jgi:hypothetical protein
MLNSEAGVRFIVNAIRGLTPSRSIRARDIDIKIKPDNYTAHINVSAQRVLNGGETVSVTVTAPGGVETAAEAIGESAGYRYVFMRAGVHYVKAEIKNAAGQVLSYNTTEMCFNYSREYDAFPDIVAATAFLERLSAEGGGGVRLQPKDVFKDFDTKVSREFDPRIIFAAAAIALFLLDIAVRKFKFKWPWELVRDHRAKRALKGRGGD